MRGHNLVIYLKLTALPFDNVTSLTMADGK